MLFDPTDGSPAYVGEGYSHARPWVHLKAAKGPRSKVAPIAAQIRRWLALGYDIPTVVLRHNLHAGQSNELEGALIRILGRRINGTGPLWNVMPGEASGADTAFAFNISGSKGAGPLAQPHHHPRLTAEAALNQQLRRRDPLLVLRTPRAKAR
jgi:hypothetical protein